MSSEKGWLNGRKTDNFYLIYYKNEYGFARNELYTNIHISDATFDAIQAYMFAKKVVDSRYAIGEFEILPYSEESIVVTSISAIMPKDMEVAWWLNFK